MNAEAPVMAADQWQRVSAAASEIWPDAVVLEPRAVHGGSSGMTCMATLRTRGRERPIMVKFAPAGLEPVGNRDVLRQARLQAELGIGDQMPVPEILFTGEAESLDRPPFYAMSVVAGEALEPLLDNDVTVLPPASVLRDRALTASRQMARLHQIPVESQSWARDLRTIGPEAEIARWRKALLSCSYLDIEDIEISATTLRNRAPEALPPVIVHGDFRLGNLLFEGGDLTAVIDWEIAGPGDPRFDLAWLCSFASVASLPTAVRDVPGLASVEEITTAYAAAMGAEPSHMDWFHALTTFKHVAVTALLTKNNLRRATPDPVLTRIADTVPSTLRRLRYAL